MFKANVIYYKTDGGKILDNWKFTMYTKDAELLLTQFAKTHPNGHYLLNKHCYRYKKGNIISTMMYLDRE